jgi:hypothetical protein
MQQTTVGVNKVMSYAEQAQSQQRIGKENDVQND